MHGAHTPAADIARASHIPACAATAPALQRRPRGIGLDNNHAMNHDDLLGGIGHIQYEWTQMAGCAARLELVDGIRTPEENATLGGTPRSRPLPRQLPVRQLRGEVVAKGHEAGGLRSHRVGAPDAEMDRRLRGRLTVINKSLAHLSWERVTKRAGVIWPTGLLAHEVHWSMHQFVDAVEAVKASSTALWSVAAAEADRWMPPGRRDWVELRGFEPAPPRTSLPLGPVALDDDGAGVA